MFADAFFELGYFTRRRGALRKEGQVNFVRRESASAADDDPVVLFLPFEDGAWSQPKSAPHLRGNGDLPLSRESRFGEFHDDIVPR